MGGELIGSENPRDDGELLLFGDELVAVGGAADIASQKERAAAQAEMTRIDAEVAQRGAAMTELIHKQQGIIARQKQQRVFGQGRITARGIGRGRGATQTIAAAGR